MTIALIILAELLLISSGCNLFFFYYQKELKAKLNGAQLLVKRERQQALFGNGNAPSQTPQTLAAGYLKYLKRLLDEALDKADEYDVKSLLDNWTALDRTKTLAVLRYLILQADWDAIHHPEQGREIWETLFDQLVPCLQQLSMPLNENQLATETIPADYNELKNNVEYYKHRVENLENFRKLFFELEENFGELQTENNRLLDELINGTEDSDELARLNAILGQFKQNQDKLVSKLRQQQAVIHAANREHYTQLPANRREREDLLFHAHPQYALAKKDLSVLEDQQKEQSAMLLRMRKHAKELKGKENLEYLVEEQEKELHKFEVSLRNTKNCIQTLELSLDDATHKIHDLELENTKLRHKAKDVSYLETSIAQFSRDSAQMMDCIQTLESTTEELMTEKELGQTKIKTLETSLLKKDQELSKLKTDFIALEERYLKQPEFKQ